MYMYFYLLLNSFIIHLQVKKKTGNSYDNEILHQLLVLGVHIVVIYIHKLKVLSNNPTTKTKLNLMKIHPESGKTVRYAVKLPIK